MAGPGKFVVDGSTGDVFQIPAPAAPAFIRILSLHLTVSATSTVTFKSGSVQMDKAYLGTGLPYSEADDKNGIMDSTPGQSFVIGNSAGTIAGSGVYTILGA